MSSRTKRISNRAWRRSVFGLALLCALAFTAPPAGAGVVRGESAYGRVASDHGDRGKRNRGKGHRGWKRPAPRVYHREYRERHHWYAPWHRPERIVYYDDRPFYFNGSFGIFFDSGAFSIRVTEAPPVGYVYHDPYCDLPIRSVRNYRSHLEHHHHPGLVEVVWVGR